jgi:hypothetical protein
MHHAQWNEPSRVTVMLEYIQTVLGYWSTLATGSVLLLVFGVAERVLQARRARATVIRLRWYFAVFGAFLFYATFQAWNAQRGRIADLEKTTRALTTELRTRSAPSKANGSDRESGSFTIRADPERGAALVELGYALYAAGPGARANLDEPTQSDFTKELSDLYGRVGLSVPRDPSSPEAFRATRHLLVVERDRICLDIGMEIAAVSAAGHLLLKKRGDPIEETARAQLLRISTELQNDLEALGIREAALHGQTALARLTPTTHESVDEYYASMAQLKASVVGAYRVRYAAQP